jgi:hypothetical protein
VERLPPDRPPPEKAIDHALDTATHHLTDAERRFLATLPGGAALDEADTVVRRAEDLEDLAEEGSDEARQAPDPDQPRP